MERKMAPNVWKNPVHFLAFGFGSGLSPKMPGTCGTVIGVAVYLTMQELPLLLYLAIFLLTFFAGIWICDRTSKDLGVHDDSGIVWDEIVGFLLTMFNAPYGWGWVILGFVLFRVFDIWKPWPIRNLEQKYQNGFGVMIDDIAAGFYALIIIQFIAWTFFSYD